MLPKQSLQSKPPLSQKSVAVVFDPEDVELSESVDGAELSVSVDGVESSELDPEGEQESRP